ncbi:HAD family hydrolase [Megalodesulfovibrio paquesii]
MKMPVQIGRMTAPSLFEGVKGIIFDCDGVLFDTRESNAQYYNAIRARLGLGPMSEAQEAYCHWHTVLDCIAHVTPSDRWPEALQARKEVSYNREILPFLRPFPGLYEALDALRSRGYLLAVHTNRTNSMENVASRYGLVNYFFPLMTASKALAKPHPEGVHRILSTWGMRREDVVFIGDSKLDQACAARAGVRFWVFGDEPLAAQARIPDWYCLLQALMRVPRVNSSLFEA